MALTVKKLVNRHGALVSAVTGALVGAAIVVLGVLQTLVQLLYTVVPGSTGLYDLVPLWSGVLMRILLVALPFAVGYFVSLWIIAPIAEELRLPHVVTRAVLATGVAATVCFIVAGVVGVIASFWLDGSLYTQSLPSALGFSAHNAANALWAALVGALTSFVANLPLGILAGVLLWLWRKDHPPRRPLSGLIDEV